MAGHEGERRQARRTAATHSTAQQLQRRDGTGTRHEWEKTTTTHSSVDAAGQWQCSSETPTRGVINISRSRCGGQQELLRCGVWPLMMQLVVVGEVDEEGGCRVKMLEETTGRGPTAQGSSGSGSAHSPQSDLTSLPRSHISCDSRWHLWPRFVHFSELGVPNGEEAERIDSTARVPSNHPRRTVVFGRLHAQLATLPHSVPVQAIETKSDDARQGRERELADGAGCERVR